ncbi:DNA-binding PadR family transcriptional regulator [Catenulispora sp. GP43]|uniref:PadR family transcriptional regulator n=1 Tax=Catenulispora sp. GP43 TaxID=3156263 RepID=UPI0035181C24
MSLRHGLLGLLAEGPASGYDLARRFSEALGSVWPAQHPQIYSELARLESAGLIEVESTGPRRRKAYRITDEGLAEVRRWLAAAEVDHTFRMETLFRAYFFWLMEPEDLKAHLASEQAFFAQTAEALRGYAATKDRGDWGTSTQTRAMRIALEAGIRINEALAGWAQWAHDTDIMTAEDFGTAKPDTEAVAEADAEAAAAEAEADGS